ncbi:14749_t:CDS:2, partial [Cetraspora pellucida]
KVDSHLPAQESRLPSTCTKKKLSTILEKHIEITQEEHVQIDLVNFCEFAEENDDFLWLLTCMYMFFKFFVAVLIKNNEAETVATHFLKNVFKILGPPIVRVSKLKIITAITTTEITITQAVASEAAATTTNTITDATTTAQAVVSETAESKAVKKHLSCMLKLQESVNKSLKKYYAKIYWQGSVHRKKIANNTIEAGATIEAKVTIAIAPDYDMNQQTRKRKLQSTFFQ